MKDDNILSVSVTEDIGSQDGMPGSFEEKPVPALMRYVKWAGKPARRVTEADVTRVVEEAKVLAELCHTQTGVYSGANAVAHNQIDNEDPMRFFVSSSGEIIINPVIIAHTKTPVDYTEACTSFADHPPVTVKRYNVVTVQFQQITPDLKLSEVIEERFSGKEAMVMQHECAHLNGSAIYDASHYLDSAIGETLLTAQP